MCAQLTQPASMWACCADEAAAAAAAARSLGLAAHVDALDWRGRAAGDWQSGGGARARRYDALYARCQQLGVGVLLMAHNSGAQLTVRARPGSVGLACTHQNPDAV